MTEILTESFCERCGTRYTFESAAPRRSRVGRVRVVSRGLRNFVMQDESTFSEAMADARSEVERAATSHQLDAFHKTFNFCLTCRQYTCGNCWNTPEGRCLTCSPIPGMELPGAADAEDEALAAAAAEAGAEVDSLAGREAWPEADLGPDRLAKAMGVVVVAADDVDVDEGVDTAAAPRAATQVRGVAPGQSLEDALAEYEAAVEAEEGAQPAAGEAAELADRVPDEPGISIEPAAAVLAAGVAVDAIANREAAPQPVAVEPEPEPVAVEPEPEPEPVAFEPVAFEPEPVAVAAEPEPEPEPVALEPAQDVVPQPTWPVAATAEAPAAPPAPTAPAPEAPVDANPWLTVAPDEPGAAGSPQWPATLPWDRRQPRRDAPTTIAGRPILPQDNAAALWAASAQEVLGGGPRPAAPVAAIQATPQPCVNCGLPLSTNARFCRRCGTRQA